MARIKVYDTDSQRWIRANSLFAPNPFTPEIIVTAPTGSVVTCTNGTNVLTATEVGGVWKFRPLYYGDWVVNATNGTKVGTSTVTVDTVKQYNIELILLPIEYTMVDYIMNNTSYSQYINTNSTVNDGTGIEITTQVVKYNSSQDFSHIFAYRYPTVSLVVNKSNYVQYEWGNTSSDCTKLTTSGINVYNKHKYSIINKIYYLDDVKIGFSDKVISSSSKYLYIFALNENGTLDDRRIQIKIFNAKIYNGLNIIKNYIPCYRKSDNKPGLYDIVDNTFLTNAGSGEFIIPTE